MAEKRGRGNISDKIDRQLLHEYLWNHTDSHGRYLGTQTELSENLGITLFTMTHIFREMVTVGRLRKIRGKYYVIDPQLWAWDHSRTT